jgi:hypothetical protein
MYRSLEYDKDLIKDVYLFNLKGSKSPLIYHYYEQTSLWTLLLDSLQDETLIKLMMFNIQFNIAPLHTFIKYYEDELCEYKLTRFLKQCLGYHVAMIFKSLGYKRIRQIYRKDAIIKYAAFYQKELQGELQEKHGSCNGSRRDISKA